MRRASEAELASSMARCSCWERIEEYWKPNWRTIWWKKSAVSCTAVPERLSTALTVSTPPLSGFQVVTLENEMGAALGVPSLTAPAVQAFGGSLFMAILGRSIAGIGAPPRRRPAQTPPS